MGLGNGIPLQDYDSVSDQGCNDGLGSGCKDSQDSVSDKGPGSGMTGEQFLGMGNGSLRPYDSQKLSSQEGHNAIQHSNPLAQVEAYVKAKMAPQDKPIKAIKRHPKKEKVIHIKHAYGDTVLPSKAKEKKAQRHLNSLARRSLNVAEDDSLPNRD